MPIVRPDVAEIKLVMVKCVGGQQPGPQAVSSLAATVGPLGLSPQKVFDRIVRDTTDWTGIKITVKVTIQHREIKNITVIPSASSLIDKELRRAHASIQEPAVRRMSDGTPQPSKRHNNSHIPVVVVGEPEPKRARMASSSSMSSNSSLSPFSDSENNNFPNSRSGFAQHPHHRRSADASSDRPSSSNYGHFSGSGGSSGSSVSTGSLLARPKTRNLSLAQVIDIARELRPMSASLKLEGTVREVLLKCGNMHCSVEGQHPMDFLDRIMTGEVRIPAN